MIHDNEIGEVSCKGVWEAFKAVIQGHFIAQAAEKRRLRKLEVTKLEQEIKDLEQMRRDNLWGRGVQTSSIHR